MNMKKAFLRTFSLVLTVALLTACAAGCNKETASSTSSQKEESSMTSSTQISSEQVSSKEDVGVSQANEYAKYTRLLGRYLPNTSGKGLTLSWTCSGFEFTFEGTAAYLNMMATGGNVLVGVFVDGAEKHTSLLEVGTYMKECVLAENLTEGKHTIRVLKLSEAKHSSLTLGNLRVNGKNIQPTEKQERVIEFIGDSITCGFGTLAENAASPFSTLEQDASIAYPYLIASHFDAEAQIIARSGIGILGNSDNGNETMPEVYEYAAYKQQNSLFEGKQFDKMTKWADVEHEAADAIVINLGTNDYAYHNNTTPFVEEYQKFLKTVRKLNPNATIIVTYGNMHTALNYRIKLMVEEMNDKKIHFVDILSEQQYDLKGAGGHPSAADHQKMAQLLTDAMKKILGWK